MKIRCENCFRVLDKNEDYCKNCGTHSEQMARAMETGDFSGGPIERLKIGFILFVTLAFLGNGIIMTILAIIKEDASMSLYNRSYAMIFSSFITFITMYIVHLKDIKDYMWNGNLKQLIGALVLGILFVVMTIFLPKLSDMTYVIPSYIVKHLQSGTAEWFGGKHTSVALMMGSLILIALVEELLFRRLLIDTLDDATLLSDTSIIIIGGVVSTILDFAWLMSFETIIVTFFMHTLLTGIYANTNRSVGINIFIRILVIVLQFVIFMK